MRRLSISIIHLACVLTTSLSAAEKPSTPGLVATYSDGKHTITQLAPTPDLVLKDAESIHPAIAPTFTADWEGFLKITQRAKYTISDSGKSGATITLDGKPISAQPTDLDLGDHPIKIHFERKPGAARLQVIWSADFFIAEPIPSSVLAHGDTPAAVEASRQIENGQLLVESLNCIACHRTTSKEISGRPGPVLSSAGARLHPAWIAKWLENPADFRHGTAMPRVNLSPEDIRDISAFLSTLKIAGDKTKEPQPSTSHVETGKLIFQTVGCTACHTKDANSLDGLGSKWLPGQLGEYLLNPQAVDHSGRMPSMLLDKSEAAALAEFLVQSKNPAYETKPAGGDSKHGEQLFRASGCINCHAVDSLKSNPAVNASAPAIPGLENLDASKGGCLSEKPTGRAVAYDLTPVQREAISAFLASLKAQPLVNPAPVYRLYHQTRAMGCVNCHELDASKPGDETERVPQLTSAGSRLRKEWIAEVLMQKRRARPWLRRRMPGFTASSVAGLPDEFVAASGATDAEPLPNPTREEIAAGQKLLGLKEGGLGCITCHGFAGAKPNVIDDTRGPDITTVAGRLRPDHFRRWVLDPKRVNPSTPMPSFFDGAPLAESSAKIETMFRYVAMGSNMPPPIGWVDKNNYQVAVHDDPVVMRTFLPNPSGGKNFPRSVAVGLPDLINYCFDADSCQLRFAWTGGFLDMQPSWAARGGNMVKILGRNFYATSIDPLEIGEGAASAREFIGYAFVDKKPQFIYRVGDVEVHETIVATPKGLGLVRTFELDSGGKPILFNAEEQPGVTYTSDTGEWTAPKDNLRTLKIPGGKVKFSVTVTVQEAK